MLLRDKELIHYSRQVILPQIDDVGQQKLKDSHVMIVGLGGLGSPASLYLSAAGVGSITIIDDDKVESSNLQRQIAHSTETLNLDKVDSAKQSMESLNPWVTVSTKATRVNDSALEELCRQNNFDVILDCSDNFDTRFAINACAVKAKIPLVSASAVAFSGQIGVFNQGADSACYQCLYDNFNLPQENCEEQGILSPVVGTMGTLQATEALKLILGLQSDKQSFLLNYRGLNSEFTTFKIPKDTQCPICQA